MANGNDIDESVSVRDAVNDAPLADTDAPKVVSTFKLRDSNGTGIHHERFNLFEHRRLICGSRFWSSLRADRAKTTV
jgi:hypothetical protein